MMKKILTKLIATILMVSVLVPSFIVLNASAADPTTIIIPTIQKNLYFAPLDAAAKLYENEFPGGKATNDIGVFTDGNNKAIYIIPICKTAKVAYLVCTVAANYTLDISGNKNNWEDLRFDPNLTGVGGCSTANKCEQAFDVSKFASQGYVYVRMGDQTNGNGWGGQLFSVFLTYRKYTPVVIKQWTTPGVDYFFTGGTDKEKSVIAPGKAGGEVKPGFRFCDAGSSCTYQWPLAWNKQAYINILVASNYVVKISIDGRRYSLLVAAPGGKYADGLPANKQMYSYNVQETIRKFFPGKAPSTFYIKVGDQTPGNGNGGQIHYMGIHYGPTNGIYNGIVDSAKMLPGKKDTSKRWLRPQRVNKLKVTVSYTPIYRTVTTQSEVSVAPVSNTVYSGVASNGIPGGLVSTIIPPEETADNSNPYLWYIILGSLSLLLIAAVVTQFLVMERRRKIGL